MSFVQTIVRGFLKCVFNLKVEGLENIPTDRGAIIAPNHTSNWDPPVVGVQTPKLMKIMAKSELFSNKLFGKLISSLGAYPVKRGGYDIDAIKTSIRLLQQGELLLMFPHGRRVKPDSDTPIKEGAVMIALKAKADIVPVYISGKYGFRKKIVVRFGKPFNLSEYYDKRISLPEQKQLSDELWKKMKELKVNI